MPNATTSSGTMTTPPPSPVSAPSSPAAKEPSATRAVKASTLKRPPPPAPQPLRQQLVEVVAARLALDAEPAAVVRRAGQAALHLLADTHVLQLPLARHRHAALVVGLGLLAGDVGEVEVEDHPAVAG